MIAHLRGLLLSKTPHQVIVECGGVGYDLTISVPTYTVLPTVYEETSLFVYTHLREDQISLFGFAEAKEKKLFEKLLTITGIGPKLAITILSGIAVEYLITAIRNQDHGTLTKIPGIGRKTAERIALELKDKLGDQMSDFTSTSKMIYGSAGEDALSALVNLGYARAVAQTAIESAIEKDATVKTGFEVLFRAAMAQIR